MLAKTALGVVCVIAVLVAWAECKPKAAPVVVARSAPYDSVLDVAAVDSVEER